MNAHCVSANAKAIQPCVRSERKKCPKSTGENVRNEREKYACFELCLSLQVGDTYSFRHGILSAHMSVRLSVRHKICPLYSWKPFKTAFIKLTTIIKHRYMTTILLYSFWS